MSSTACYIENSARIVRLLTPDSDSRWTPGKDISEDDPFGPRNLINDAAAWLTKSIAPKKRIDLVCLGVNDTICRWLTAPSSEPGVIAAAARGKGEEWGPGATLGAIESLSSPHRKSTKLRPGDKTENHFPVLAIRDAPTRVLLDDLDANGVRIGSVITLWHAMCRAWDESLPTERVREELAKGSDNGDTEPAVASPITAIIATTDDNSVAWAWSRGRQLVTGGRAAVARSEPINPSVPDADSPSSNYKDAFGHIALDWLTWTAQLGQSPDRIIIVSPDADAIAQQCDRLWPAATHREVVEADPVGATIKRLIAADAIKPESDARTCVVALTNRPSRAHRTLSQWIGVIMLGIAIAIVGLGWQFHSQAKTYSKMEQEFKNATTNKLKPIDERIARDPRPVIALKNKINELAAGTDGFVEPELPLPILDELLRVISALEQTEGITVERVQITESRSILRLQVPDTATGEQIIEALRTSKGHIRWTESAGGPLSGRLTLNGAWTLESNRL